MTQTDPHYRAISGLGERLAQTILTLAVLGLAGFAVLFAVFSLKWPLHHDLPVLMYNGFLMHDLGLVPYRDFFEVNTPGTMILYGGLHLITQGNETTLRVIDLTLLALFAGVTTLAMRDHGWRAGLVAASAFAIIYLSTGHAMSLQREYIGVLMLAISTLIAFRMTATGPVMVPLVIMGLLAGLSACIKPPFILMWLPLVLFVLAVQLTRGRMTIGAFFVQGFRLGIPFCLGLALPLVGIYLYLLRIGALDAYLEIMVEYYPYYTQLRGDGGVWLITGFSLYLQRFIVAPLQLFADFPFVVLSFIGLSFAWALRGRAQFMQLWVIVGFVAMGVAYAMTSGKYWPYHSFPLHFALALLAGLAFSTALPRPTVGALWGASVLAGAVAIGLPLGGLLDEFRQWRDPAPIVVKEGRVDLVEKYLAANTTDTDSVMVFDVASGGLHALYRLRKPMHGPFIYTFHVFHHIDSEIVQKLRKRMLAQFDANDPDYVVWFDFAWGHAKNFPELEAILETEFEVVLQENSVTILRRKP